MRSYLSNGIINIEYIKSCDKLADPLTKALTRERVWNTSRGMGLKPIQSWAMYEDTQLGDQKSWEQNESYDGHKKLLY